MEIHGPFPTEVLKPPEALALDMNKSNHHQRRKSCGPYPLFISQTLMDYDPQQQQHLQTQKINASVLGYIPENNQAENNVWGRGN